MVTTEVQDLDAQLDRYLALVKNGEDVLVTEQGVIIARIIHESPPRKPLRHVLLPLVRSGQIRLPTREIDRQVQEPIKLPGKPVSEMALEDRR